MGVVQNKIDIARLENFIKENGFSFYNVDYEIKDNLIYCRGFTEELLEKSQNFIPNGLILIAILNWELESGARLVTNQIISSYGGEGTHGGVPYRTYGINFLVDLGDGAQAMGLQRYQQISIPLLNSVGFSTSYITVSGSDTIDGTYQDLDINVLKQFVTFTTKFELKILYKL